MHRCRISWEIIRQLKPRAIKFISKQPNTQTFSTIISTEEQQESIFSSFRSCYFTFNALIDRFMFAVVPKSTRSRICVLLKYHRFAGHPSECQIYNLMRREICPQYILNDTCKTVTSVPEQICSKPTKISTTFVLNSNWSLSLGTSFCYLSRFEKALYSCFQWQLFFKLMRALLIPKKDESSFVSVL